MKVIAYCCLVISSLVVLAWPALLFLSIFLFDAPTRDFLYELRRYTIFILFLTYPWGYVVAMTRLRLVKNSGGVWWTNKLTIGFFLVPFAQLGLAYVLFS
jgi:hypothetical protein